MSAFAVFATAAIVVGAYDGPRWAWLALGALALLDLLVRSNSRFGR